MSKGSKQFSHSTVFHFSIRTFIAYLVWIFGRRVLNHLGQCPHKYSSVIVYSSAAVCEPERPAECHSMAAVCSMSSGTDNTQCPPCFLFLWLCLSLILTGILFFNSLILFRSRVAADVLE